MYILAPFHYYNLLSLLLYILQGKGASRHPGWPKGSDMDNFITYSGKRVSFDLEHWISIVIPATAEIFNIMTR